MPQLADRFALCMVLAGLPVAAQAQTGPGDLYADGAVIELGFGLLAPTNTLQDTLTTPNGGGAQVKSTDLLEFGTGGRVSLAYSRPWGADGRLIFSLTGARASGDAPLRIGTSSEALPGTYDDGFNLPANWTLDAGIETRTVMLKIGREWALDDRWRVSGGLQGGTASQDFVGLLSTPDGEAWRSISSDSENRMIGVFGGVSHYTALSNVLGLRLSANLGVMRNSFDYSYANVLLPDDLAPFDQFVSGESSGTAVSTQLSVRLERSLSDTSMLTFELGYEGISGIGNGADTLLDADGTNDAAAIDSDRIGAAYLSVGYAFRF